MAAMCDWVFFIPEEFWPFFRRRLTDMKLPGSDDNRFTEAQAADWQSWDVLTVMDCILESEKPEASH